MDNRLLIIDGNSVAYRAYFATLKANYTTLTTQNGKPINALLTFINMFFKSLKDYGPSHVLIAFDAGKKTNRHRKYSAYKGKRAKTPLDLIVQFPLIKQFLDLLQVKHFELLGVEADDIIASAVNKYVTQTEIIIISSDKDLYQLVQDKVQIVLGSKAKAPFLSKINFKQIVGVMPQQIADLKGIMGDHSDNLPGVNGIGPSGAKKLIAQYHSLENIYQHLDQLPKKTQEKLLKDQKQAFLSKELVTLETNIDLPYSFSDLAFNVSFSSHLHDFFYKYEFKSLLKKYFPQNQLQNEKKQLKSNFENLIF